MIFALIECKQGVNKSRKQKYWVEYTGVYSDKWYYLNGMSYMPKNKDDVILKTQEIARGGSFQELDWEWWREEMEQNYKDHGERTGFIDTKGKFYPCDTHQQLFKTPKGSVKPHLHSCYVFYVLKFDSIGALENAKWIRTQEKDVENGLEYYDRDVTRAQERTLRKMGFIVVSTSYS